MRVKNFTSLQHYKNRNPAWIKLYREILNDFHIHNLDDKSFRAYINTLVVASEDKDLEGKLPDFETWAFKLRITPKELEEILPKLSRWVVPDEYSDDKPERISLIKTARDAKFTVKTFVSKPAPDVGPPTDEWIQDLKASKNYEGINIDSELSKMDAWIASPKNRNGRKKTKTFIKSWLKRSVDYSEPARTPEDPTNPTGKSSEELRIEALKNGWNGV
jgi:hypothetical protein